MQARIDGRRAAPPRPTLLVGDLAACQAAFARLQQRVLELSLQQQASVVGGVASVDAWRDLVPRCRALRETLTSLRELSHFTREVYECAADVCARAQDYPEALKALQQLVHHIYPALAARQHAEEQQAQRWQQPGPQEAAAGGSHGPPALSRAPAGAAATAAATTTKPSPGWTASMDDQDDESGLLSWVGPLDCSTVAAALECRQFQRWPEVAAALALYFACVQQQAADRLDTLSTLRRLPRRLLQVHEVQLALRLHTALAAGDWVTLFRLREQAPLLVQLIVDAAAPRVREQALVVLAAAYRNIAVAAVCRMLHLGESRELLACLKLLGDRGHLAAQRALGGLQQEEQPSAADLVFKG